jgi:hypothetical protein
MMMMVVMFLLLASLNEYTSGLLDKYLGYLDTEQFVEFLGGHVGELIHAHHERHIGTLVVSLDLLVVRLEHLILLVVLPVRRLHTPVLSHKVQIGFDNFLIID